MANLLDYLAWRGDVPMGVDYFSETDNLALAEMAYTDFSGIVPGNGERIPLPEAKDAFFSNHTREELLKQKSYTAKAPLVLPDMADGDRFRETQLCYYINEVDKEADMQLSAVTCVLPDDTVYVAFRGTDGSVVGWKEDFNFSFLPETAGQKRAVEYLNHIGRVFRQPLRVGGHSKGGHLAVYASAFCEEYIQNRILQVYSNDGPGFRQELTVKEGYLRIRDRVFSIIPDTSVIGLLFSEHERHTVVASSARGLAQHDGFSWKIRRNRFVRARLSETGRLAQGVLGNWLESMNDSDRETLTDLVFSLFESTGQERFSAMNAQKLKTAEAMINASLGLPREKQQALLRLIAQLAQSSSQTAAGFLARFLKDRSYTP